MQIIGPLAAGVRGAESGTATLRRRGTSSPATYYTSAEADSAISSGEVVLDQNGGATVYVNEAVDVVVRDEQGSTVRAFTQMSQAGALEVISQSFTGQDYDSGSQATSKPVTGVEVFDRWWDSAGASDWKVRVEGEAMLLEDAIGRGAGVFFNVKSPEFGAVGDGTEDDTAAINAALAEGPTGIIFFPAGAYRITDSLNAKNGQLWILAPGATIVPDGIDDQVIVVTSSTSATTPFRIQGGKIEALESCAADIIYLNTGMGVDVQNLFVAGSLFTGNFIRHFGPSSYIAVKNSIVQLAGAASAFVTSASDDAKLLLDDSSFLYAGAGAWSASAIKISAGRVRGCTVDAQAGGSASGTLKLIEVDASPTGPISIADNVFTAASGQTVTAIDATALDGSDLNTVVVNGNSYTNVDDRVLSSGTFRSFQFGDRIDGEVTTSDTSASFDHTVYSSYTVMRTGAAGALAIDVSKPVASLPVGSEFVLVINNGTLGNVSVTWGSGFIADLQTLAALEAGTWRFRRMRIAGADRIVQISAAAIIN